MNGATKTHRGRLAILSANTPALMIGMIGSGTYTLAGGDEHGDDDCCDPAGDDNMEVFVAVKTS